MPEAAEVRTERDNKQCCWLKGKSAKPVEACLLTLSIVIVLALFALPVIFFFAQVQLIDAHMLRTNASQQQL